jgi:hypothetical protein
MFGTVGPVNEGQPLAPVEYRTIGASLRPPRFVVGYRPGQDWIYSARRVVASISRVWGGNGAIIAPVGESAVTNKVLVLFMRAYDPDHIAGHVQILADLAHDSPERYGRNAQKLAGQEDISDDVWQELSAAPIEGQDWTGLAEQVDSFCSPFKGFGPGIRQFRPNDILWLDRSGQMNRHLTTISDKPGERTLTLDLSQVDPAISLMVETRIGSVDLVGREGRNVVELPVMDEDLPGLVRLAIAGTVRPHTWDLQARYAAAVDEINTSDPDLTVDRFLTESPFARCGQSTIKARTSFPQPPVVCVIGETADDHALALLCDRLFHHAAWVPTHLLAENERLRTAVRTALYELGHVTGAPGRPTLVTSISEPSTVVDSLAADLNTMFGFYTADGQPFSDPRRPESIDPVTLATERGRSMLADPAAFSLRRRTPVANDAGDVSMLTPVAVPLPQAVEYLGTDLHWYIDVSMSGRQLPARTSLSSERLQENSGPFPEAIVRAGRDGLSFASPNFGYVMAGASHDFQLAQPLLRFPSADVLFAELATAANARVARSTAGHRSAIAVEMWGSLEAVTADLKGPVRKLLDAFFPPHNVEGDYGIGYEIRGDGYVALEDAVEVLSVERYEARDTIDRLLALNVLRQGFLLYCARCRTYAFYRIDQVGSTFECHACGHASQLSRGQWYSEDPEPHWYYSLDQVVHDLLASHGDVPLLAAADLSRRASSVLWSPELEVTDDSDSVELDICLIVDGRIIVGEAKSNRTLKGDKGTKHVAQGLAHAAQLLSADEIVLATSSATWTKDTISAVHDAISQSWTKGPKPLITERTRVGAMALR